MGRIEETHVADAPPILLGSQLPDVDVWSDRVVVALGQNPSAFTGPGTNTYLVGTGPRRILLDTGDGRNEYLPILEQALERAECEGLDEIVLTHGHSDHVGGAESVMKRLGEVPVRKRPWPESDSHYSFEITPIDDGQSVRTEGATLRAFHSPGHCPDHLCFVLEEEGAVFSGDNVLGIGTTVIPAESGDLSQYMDSLAKLEREQPTRIYPAHGPRIDDGRGKVREYIEHRLERESQILRALGDQPRTVIEIVRVVYAAYPEALHPAACQTVISHLTKLARDGTIAREDPGSGASPEAVWKRC